MRKLTTWRDKARAAVELRARVWEQDGGDPDDRKALLRFISAGYPWGERRGWPYRVWLSEVRNYRVLRGWELPRYGTRRRKRKIATEQLELEMKFPDTERGKPCQNRDEGAANALVSTLTQERTA